MLKYSDLRGAVFDVDETLLDNHPDGTSFGLHEQSRLAAAHAVGQRVQSPGLIAFTPEQSSLAFREAKQHTLHAAVWQMLIMAGETPDRDVDLAHPLLLEIVDLKDNLHEELLRTQAREVPGALRFVQGMALRGISMSVASTACRRDIDVFFEMNGFAPYFPDKKIISRERFTHPKPDPEPFNLAFGVLGLPEETRAYVAAFEDDPRGVASAKAAGLYTLAIATRYSRDQLAALDTPPDIIFDSYDELDALLASER